MFSIFSSESHVFYEIIWKNMVDPDRPQTTTRSKRITC